MTAIRLHRYASPIVTEWVDGQCWDTLGVATALSGGSRCANFIPVQPSSTVTFYLGIRPGGTTLYMVQYNANKERVNSTYNANGAARTVTIPANCYYIRISCETANKENVYVHDDTNGVYLVESGRVLVTDKPGRTSFGKMGVGATMLKQGKTARDYVQNGLVAMWDGIENAGWGTHNASATTWKDLVGSADITLTNAQIFADHIYFPKGSGYGSAAFPTPFGCIEVVLSKNVSSIAGGQSACIVQMGSTLYSGYGVNAPIGRVTDTYDAASAPYISVSDGELFSATLNKDGAATSEIAKNGVIGAAGTVAAGSRYANSSNCINTSISGNARSSDIWFRCMRVYSRNLTADEIAANYAIDKERFNLP